MHRTTGRFWTGFARLPEEVQRVARQNFALPGRIPRTPRCISKKLEIFGPPGPGSIIVRSRWRTAKTSSGCGLVLTTSTSD